MDAAPGPLRIGLNLFLLQAHVGGVAHYVQILLREWNTFFPQDVLVPFTFDPNEALLAEAPDHIRRQQVRLRHQEEIFLHARKMDVFFCPFGALYPRPFPRPAAVTLLDIQERFFPEFFSKQELKDRLWHFDASVAAADVVITISEFSRQALVEIIGAPADKVRAIPLCPDRLPGGEVRPPLPGGWPERFLFYPAQDWRHKNHERLLDALALLRSRGRLLPCVFTGGWHQEGRVEQHIREAGLEEQVAVLGRVSREEIAWLYRHARLLLFPSLFEGFGIPVVEAMRSGLPVVCSGTTSLPEVGGDAAVYFDPEDTASMAEALSELWDDEARLAVLREAGLRREALFTEENMVRRHREALAEAVRRYRALGMMGRWRRLAGLRKLPPAEGVVPPGQLEKAALLMKRQRRAAGGGGS